jgi:hypothetical protein
MAITSTYTYAILEISQAAFDEIKAKLEAADYRHAIIREEGCYPVLDMHGIALKAIEGKEYRDG